MSLPIYKGSFSSGELSPSLYGRLDLAKWHSGLSVCRNMVVNYKGGVFSRAGTALVGICKQPALASSYPPRNIEFTFNIFQSYILEFGDAYMRVVANGAYVTEAGKTITGITQANPGVVTAPTHGFSNGDWVFISGVVGMTQINGRTLIVANAAANTFSLTDLFGAPASTFFYAAYTSGGTAARIYTLTTPYAAKDLGYLKSTQSADVMSLCCVNQATGVDYPPQELTRLAANNWTIGPPAIASSIAAPASCTATASHVWAGPLSSTNPGPAAYGYVVTAIDSVTNQESQPSPIGTVIGSVDIAGQFGTITVTWGAVAGASQYNIYRATPDYSNVGNFTGQLFGYVGTVFSTATSWTDTNIIADDATTPPQHYNPFASSGNYPGVVEYFQQRRVYAETLNNPDEYIMSRPGAFTNFDASIPPIDSDAVTGSPWAKQVNAIQALMPMPGGLIVGTGKDAWQLSGTGGAFSPVTPSQQQAQQQESIGFSPFLQPIKINYTIIYGSPLGAGVREMNYNFYFQIYAGNDITILSSHLFQGHTLTQWAWAHEPYKTIWAVRDDGKLLSLSYLKEQEVTGWARHDTNGLVVSVAVASEPPVHALYPIVKRWIPGKNTWIYTQERMDNRLWKNIDQAWCVDAGLSLPQPTPNANLAASRAAPTQGALAGPMISGGANYSALVSGAITDPTGTGAMVNSVAVVAGAITGYTISPAGSGYTNPQIVFTDATGVGAIAQVLIDQSVTFTADAAVFSAGNVGSVIRSGGGIATITAYVSPTQVTANFIKPITAVITDDPHNLPVPQPSGSWTMTAPVSSVANLDYLEGMTVTGVADGRVIPPTVVQNGQVNLSDPASNIVIGLPFVAQAQSMHAELGGEQIQGKRKRIQAVTARLRYSRGVQLGQDQPIAATHENDAELPWNIAPNLMTMVEMNDPFVGYGRPLFTGDRYVVLAGDYNTADGQASPGMVALMQDLPLPAELLAFVPLLELGDIPDG